MERVMIIDSDMVQMQELNHGLSGEYQILNCSRGSKAMELFRIYQPSALVIDPFSFELNGKNFIRQIRSLPGKNKIPVLALTRITTLKHIEESFDWGVDAIYSKPCSAERIQKKLREYFGQPARTPQLEAAGV